MLENAKEDLTSPVETTIAGRRTVYGRDDDIWTYVVVKWDVVLYVGGFTRTSAEALIGRLLANIA